MRQGYRSDDYWVTLSEHHAGQRLKKSLRFRWLTLKTPWRKSDPNSTSELRGQDFGPTAAKEQHMTIRTQLTVAIDDVCNRFSPIVCNFLDDRWLVMMALMEAPDLNDDELAAKVGLSQSQVKKIFREVEFGSVG